MTFLQEYLQRPKTRKVLSKKLGDEGFSLIELVVVVAVLAVLSAIAIPNFTNISNKARAAAASATMTTIVKECAAKVADAGSGTYVVPSLNGYTAWRAAINGTNLTAGSSGTCHVSSGEYELKSSDESQYPTWQYNVGTAAKTCAATAGSAALQRGCNSAGTW
tara:strand:+ start:144 stop:632 length:489 start_codon:yes stop_codon:yes gene_type:complete